MSDYSLMDMADEFHLFDKGEIDRQTQIADFLLGFFKDQEKVYLWFNTKNPLLGGIKPLDMIRQGRSEKLLKFIQAMLRENKHE